MNLNILEQIVDYMSGKCEDPIGGNEGVTEYDENETWPADSFRSGDNEEESN